MSYGLSAGTLAAIQSVFANFNGLEKAVLFGSRAKGNHSLGSDIDIALSSQGLSFDDYLSLLVKIDDLDLPNKVDLIRFETIQNQELVDHIERVGITIWEKNSSVPIS